MENAFGRNLKRALEEREILQKDFAKKIGVQKQMVTYWIKGSHIPKIYDLCKISDALGMTPDELMEGMDEQGKK